MRCRRARRAQREGEHPDRVPRRAASRTCAPRCASSCAWRASACTTLRCGRSRRTRAPSCSSSLRASGRLPRLDDDYYASLLSYSDISGAVSYADALDSRQLQRYRLAGLLLFYGASYLTHPARPLRSLYNIATRRYESRMEMSFGNLVRRLSAARATGARAGWRRRSARHVRHLRSRAPGHRGAFGVGAAGGPRAGAGVRGAAVLVGDRHRFRAPGAPARPAPRGDRRRASPRRRPDVVAFTSYSVTHRWAIDVARAREAALRGADRLRRPARVGGAGTGDPRVVDRRDRRRGGRGRAGRPDRVRRARPLRTHRRRELHVQGRRRGRCATACGRCCRISTRCRGPTSRGSTMPVPAFEHEFYVVSRRGCPFRCSFCEYSTFPKQYPGEKPVRRRSVEHLIARAGLLEGARPGAQGVLLGRDLHARRRNGWRSSPPAYRREIGIPFECYTHPQTMTRDMARWLAEAGCMMVRVGVQSVNSDTLGRRRSQGRPGEGGADPPPSSASTACRTRWITSSGCPARARPTSSTRCASTPRCSRSGSSPTG